MAKKSKPLGEENRIKKKHPLKDSGLFKLQGKDTLSGMAFTLIPIKHSDKTAIFIKQPFDKKFTKSYKGYWKNRILIPSEEKITNRPDITSDRVEYLTQDFRNKNTGQFAVDDFIKNINKDLKHRKNEFKKQGKSSKKPLPKLDNIQGWISIKASNNKGSIREDDLLARFIDTSVGVGKYKKSKARNIFVDWSQDAEVNTEPDKNQDKQGNTQYPKKAWNNDVDYDKLSNLYSWVRRPNLYDADLIDTSDSKFRPEAKSVLKAIVSGSPEDVATFRKIIAKNFTQREQRLLNRAIVKLGDTRSATVAGTYRNAEKFGVEKDVLTIDPNFLYTVRPNKNTKESDLVKRKDRENSWTKSGKFPIDEDTATHEFIHMLRERDKDRKGVHKAPPDIKGDDGDLEESMTDTETNTRTTNNPTVYSAGYHHHSAKLPKPAKENKLDINTKSNEDKKLYDKLILKKHSNKINLNNKDYFLPKKSDKYATDKDDFKTFRSLISYDIQYGIDNKTSKPEVKKVWKEKLNKFTKKTGITKKDIQDSVKKLLKSNKGKRAIKVTEKAFPSTFLSSLRKHKKRGELVDTFFEYQTKDGKTRIETQIYSPKGNLSKKDAIEIASLGRTSGKLIEEEDGKKLTKNLLKEIRLKKPEPKISKPKVSKKFRR
tara:strand:- start:1710 stop:3677 length:1968 start_codon:yes stop_codon:yes gene_type:complete